MPQSNKSLGTSFERELAHVLSKLGYWCKVFNTGTGQPCDVIAVKENCAYFLECKTAKGDIFPTARIEANQHEFYRFSASKGNTNCFIAVRFKSGIKIFHFSDIVSGTKTLRFEKGLDFEDVF